MRLKSFARIPPLAGTRSRPDCLTLRVRALHADRTGRYRVPADALIWDHRRGFIGLPDRCGNRRNPLILIPLT